MSFQGIFLKFGKESDIDQLQKLGLVYCNTVKYFKELEDDEMRSDELETSDFIGTRKDLILQIWPQDKPNSITRIALNRIVSHIESPFGNLYCMYSLEMANILEDDKFKIDTRLKKKSESFLIIKDVPEFINRLHKHLDKQQYSWEHHMVEYIDFSDFYGKRTIFQKDKQYDYQNEFRVFIRNDKHDVIKVEIGDISDISIKFPSSILDTAYFTKR